MKHFDQSKDSYGKNIALVSAAIGRLDLVNAKAHSEMHSQPCALRFQQGCVRP